MKIISENQASVERLALKVAHEINDPLTRISGQLQLRLSEMKSNDPDYHTYEVLEEETQRIAEVVRNLMSYAYTDHHETEDHVLEKLLRSRS